jgi:3'-5' exoribonuclease
MKDAADYCKENLENLAHKLDLVNIASVILNDSNFIFQSGSANTIAHHYGIGGLIRHTWEVCAITSKIADFYAPSHPDINRKELFVSALYHDYGKVWDYEFDPGTNAFTPTKHRRKIHHIPRSAIEWEIIARRQCLDTSFIHNVTHNILSHHGQREWGSPIKPLSREAWILHLADSISARVDDCDRIDLAEIKY